MRRRIDAWREVQDVYMPGVRALREPSSATLPTTSPQQPETINLMLPSAMRSLTSGLGCIEGLAAKEGRLRLAQADDALRELRRQLRVSAQIVDFRKNTVGGTSQRMATKTQTLMKRFHDKTHQCARRYSAAYDALCSLNHPGNWRDRLRPLNHSTDLRLPGRDKEMDKKKEERESEGRRELSWIWLAPRREGDRDTDTGDEYSIGELYMDCMVFFYSQSFIPSNARRMGKAACSVPSLDRGGGPYMRRDASCHHVLRLEVAVVVDTAIS